MANKWERTYHNLADIPIDRDLEEHPQATFHRSSHHPDLAPLHPSLPCHQTFEASAVVDTPHHKLGGSFRTGVGHTVAWGDISAGLSFRTGVGHTVAGEDIAAGHNHPVGHGYLTFHLAA